MRQGIILFAHGSKVSEANQELEELALNLEDNLNSEVSYANLQFIKPDFWSAVEDLLAEQVNKVIVVPLFMFSGRHVQEDIPQLISTAEKKYSEIEFEVVDHLAARKGDFLNFLAGELKEK
jgi:sirohydrochlorin ferrochelatase